MIINHFCFNAFIESVNKQIQCEWLNKRQSKTEWIYLKYENNYCTHRLVLMTTIVSHKKTEINRVMN